MELEAMPGHSTVRPAHQPSPSIPIVRAVAPVITTTEREQLADLASRLRRDEPALGATTVFGPRVSAGLLSGPALLIGDQSEIPLLSRPGASQLGYRATLLAGAGDMLLLGHERSPSYERYMAALLGISAVEILSVPDRIRDDATPVARRCLDRPDFLARIADVAAATGCLSVIPHIATGNSWLLACEIAARSDVEVGVCGPPPRLTRRVNDKLWFASRAREILGQNAVPPTFAAYGPAALAGHVAHLAARYQRVVVKLPDSAGSAGNLPLESSDLRGLPLAGVTAMLVGLIQSHGWGERYPLMVEVWDCDVLASPSAQIWIPHVEDGLPVIEGLFEQFVEGAEGLFVGAARARLPRNWIDRLAAEAMRVALVFQHLGYFGRCSFDAIIYGRDYDTAALHWIECNGRWGGVSLPMTLAHRLLDDPASQEIVIIQHQHMDLSVWTFDAALDRISDLLFEPGTRPEGIVLLTPTCLERGTGIHLMAIARQVDHAHHLARQATARLGLAPPTPART
jgi:hypothetical protein